VPGLASGTSSGSGSRGGAAAVGGGKRDNSSAYSKLRAWVEALLDELGAAVEAAALADFNDWLVAVRHICRPKGPGNNCLQSEVMMKCLYEKAYGDERAWTGLSCCTLCDRALLLCWVQAFAIGKHAFLVDMHALLHRQPCGR
jgi:hypothetical protein